MIKRLRFKFVCINMVIVTAMLYVIFSLVIFFMGMGMEIQSRNMMQDVLNNAFRSGWKQEGRMPLRRPHFVVQIGEQGELLGLDCTYFGEIDKTSVLEYAGDALARNDDSGTLKAQKLRYHKKPIPNGHTIVFADASAEMNTMEELKKTCLFIGAISFSVFFVISCLLARWAVKPVETAWNQQRQFVADASHELKTPLTVIMTNAELLQSPDYDENQRNRLLDSILTMSHQMRGLVEGLLDLARVDNCGTKTVFEELNLSELVSEAMLPFEPVYFEKDLLLESGIEEGVRVRGSASHLRQVVEILLDNGAKYATAKGQVTVKLQRQGNHCLLSVSDPGEPISREDLKNIFKRFYRIDKARTMNHSYGLGLSIAENIIKEHKGKIWAESEKGINTFFVQLPAA